MNKPPVPIPDRAAALSKRESLQEVLRIVREDLPKGSYGLTPELLEKASEDFIAMHDEDRVAKFENTPEYKRAQKDLRLQQMVKMQRSELEMMAFACLLNGATEIINGLQETDFSDGNIRKLFVAARNCYQVLKSVDLIELHHSLNGIDWYDALGGAAFLTDLLNRGSAWGVSSAKRIVEMLSEARARSPLHSIQIALESFGDGEVGEVLEYIKQKVSQAQAALPKATARSIKNMATELENRIVPKLPTGFPLMDKALHGGIADGAMLILAARPGAGKTTLALNIAANVAQMNKRVLFLSLEMSAEDIAQRFMCGYAREPLEMVSKHAKSLFPNIDGDVLIDDSRRTLGAVQTAMLYNTGCDLFIIDYLQLMAVDGMDRAKRAEQISVITGSLKRMAMELQKPIILLSQLNRASEQDRYNREPRLSDLRDSGSIEQDADYVSFLWDKNAKKDGNDSIDDDDWGIEPNSELDIRWILRKNRFGPPNRMFKMQFTADCYLFEHRPSKEKPKDAPKKAMF